VFAILLVLFVPRFVSEIWQMSLYFVFLFALTALAMCFIYKENPWEIVFCCTAAYCAQNISSNFCEAILYFKVALDDNFIWVHNLWQAITLIITYVAVYFLFARKIKKEEVININNKQVIVISLVSIIVVVLLSWVVGGTNIGSIENVACKCLTMICGFLILTIQFGLLNQNKLQNDLAMVQQMWKKDQEHYRISKADMDLINIKFHDLKHLVSSPSDNTRQEFKNEMNEALKIYDLALHTGNQALDVLLMEKGLYCYKHNIDISCMADGERLNFMKDVDIYSLFGNALDNAIESTMKLKDKTKRVISLLVSAKADFLTIHMENYYEGCLSFKDGLPQTTKDDKTLHGFGVKSISLLAEKYNGNVSMSTDSDIFILNIIFPLKPSLEPIKAN
jgi:hypothetical protein